MMVNALGEGALTSTSCDIISVFARHPEWADINALVEQKKS